MKLSCIFKQVLCLMSLLIVTCDSKGPARICSTARIIRENENLLNKTVAFKKHFPDDITNIKLLTNTLKKEFIENCSTRHQLLSFYTKKVLSEKMVASEAKKSGIDEAFLRIEDMLKLCRASKCQETKATQVTKATEETEGMKELENNIKKITLKEKLHKAISEIDILLTWINVFITDIRRKGR